MKLSEEVACYFVNVTPFLELRENDNGNPRIIDEEMNFLDILLQNDILRKGLLKPPIWRRWNGSRAPFPMFLEPKCPNPSQLRWRGLTTTASNLEMWNANYADESCKVITEATFACFSKSPPAYIMDTKLRAGLQLIWTELQGILRTLRGPDVLKITYAWQQAPASVAVKYLAATWEAWQSGFP